MWFGLWNAWREVNWNNEIKNWNNEIQVSQLSYTSNTKNILP